MIYIRAKNRQHAKYYAIEQRIHPNRWLYLDNIDMLRGNHKPVVIVLDSYGWKENTYNRLVEEERIDLYLDTVQSVVINVTDL